MHYYLHHFRPRGPLGRMLRERHMRHHFQDDTTGFGISAPYWDEVFRTSSARPPQPGALPRDDSRCSGVEARRAHVARPSRSRLDARPRARASKKASDKPKGRGAVAATNINRVVMTGNLTADPELRSLPSGTSVCKLRDRLQHAPQGREHGRMGRQAQLLQRHGVGRAGRERRALPVQGTPRRDRRAPRVARVGDPGRHKTPGNRYHCRLGAVPGLAR